MKVKINKIFLSNNFLDRDFQRVLLPIRCTQYMFFLSKFTIKRNCIRPNKKSYNIISFFGMMFFVVLNLYNITVKEENDLNINEVMNIGITINCTMYLPAFFAYYINNIITSKQHVEMILKIQKAFRIIKYKNYQRFIFWNWSYVIRHTAVYILFTLFKANFAITIYFFSLVYFDVNISCGICIIELLRDGILTWQSEVEYHSKRCLEIDGEENVWRELFQAYSDLLKAFDIYKEVFRIGIMFHAIDTFIHTLVYVQMSLELITSGLLKDHSSLQWLLLFVSVYAFIWSFKNMFLISMLSGNCAKIYATFEDVETLCCSLMESNNHIRAKRLYKNVIRLNRAKFSKMSAFRLFTIDASLPQNLISLVLTYVIVLLQFAFL